MTGDRSQVLGLKSWLSLIWVVAIAGIAMEIGIEPTARHGADLGYIPVVVTDACGFGHKEAAERSLASLEFAGDSFLTTTDMFCTQLGQPATRTK